MEYYQYTDLLRAIEDQFGLDFDYLCGVFDFHANQHNSFDFMETRIVAYALNPWPIINW